VNYASRSPHGRFLLVSRTLQGFDSCAAYPPEAASVRHKTARSPWHGPLPPHDLTSTPTREEAAQGRQRVSARLSRNAVWRDNEDRFCHRRRPSSMREVLSRVIEKSGYRVPRFPIAAPACPSWDWRIPTRLWSDVQMPGMTGIDFARGSRPGIAVPVILVHGGIPRPTWKRGLVTRGERRVREPIRDVARFSAAVDRWCPRGRTRKEERARPLG